MCGRFAQYQGKADYLAALQSEQDVISGYDNVPLEHYNVMPHAKAQLLHAESAGLVFDAVRWGWKPHWAGPGGPKNDFNARLDTVASSKFYRTVWPHRALVCADGWYEWLKNPQDKKDNQPYYLRAKGGSVLFIPAVGQFPALGQPPRDDDGFRMITDDATGGMLDVHDRRPVVLTGEQAREWLHQDTSSERAEQLLRQGLPAEAFEWFRVSKAVSQREDGPYVIQPLPNDQAPPGA